MELFLHWKSYTLGSRVWWTLAEWWSTSPEWTIAAAQAGHLIGVSRAGALGHHSSLQVYREEEWAEGVLTGISRWWRDGEVGRAVAMKWRWKVSSTGRRLFHKGAKMEARMNAWMSGQGLGLLIESGWQEATGRWQVSRRH
jgi:hypothetical protein